MRLVQLINISFQIVDFSLFKISLRLLKLIVLK